MQMKQRNVPSDFKRESRESCDLYSVTVEEVQTCPAGFIVLFLATSGSIHSRCHSAFFKSSSEIHFKDEFRPPSDKKIVLFELSDPQLDLRILAPDRVGVIAVSCPPEDEVILTSTAARPDCDVLPSLVWVDDDGRRFLPGSLRELNAQSIGVQNFYEISNYLACVCSHAC